ncbi:MAG: hypothetical protein H6737_14175 [Alphaproteobacteria bacterium]|nr:hypothetical protein [Alphaproteobacteria bacterium]
MDPDLKSLYDAVSRRDRAEVRRLLDAGVDLNAPHRWLDERPLYLAVCDPVDTDLLRLLLERGADPRALHPETGGTALHQLLHASLPLDAKVAALDLLIAHGADLNVVGESEPGSEYTALDIALDAGWDALASALRARGAVPGPYR